jgi:hypothetical protein
VLSKSLKLLLRLHLHRVKLLQLLIAVNVLHAHVQVVVAKNQVAVKNQVVVWAVGTLIQRFLGVQIP